MFIILHCWSNHFIEVCHVLGRDLGHICILLSGLPWAMPNANQYWSVPIQILESVRNGSRTLRCKNTDSQMLEMPKLFIYFFHIFSIFRNLKNMLAAIFQWWVCLCLYKKIRTNKKTKTTSTTKNKPKNKKRKNKTINPKQKKKKAKRQKMTIKKQRRKAKKKRKRGKKQRKRTEKRKEKGEKKLAPPA